MIKFLLSLILDYVDRKKLKACLTILLFGSLLALIFAYISQYVFGFEPCILCFYQRKPFFFIAILTFLGRFLLRKKSRQKLIIIAGIALLAVNAAIAFYHSGVEKKIFTGPSSCSSVDLAEISDLQELSRKITETQAVRCDEPQFYFLGLTIAEWNLLYCLTLMILVWWMMRRIIKNEREKAEQKLQNNNKDSL